MSATDPRFKPYLLPGVIAVVALLALVFWVTRGSGPLSVRVPGTDRGPENELGTNANAVLAGKLVKGDGQPANLPGAWPQFRGPERDGIGHETIPLLRDFAPGSPRQLWAIDVGEGYAGPAIFGGRVYLMDYDRDKKQDALRCLSLEDGREIWRFAYPVAIKRNHGMSRTVPAIQDPFVVAIGPKCHVVCVDATSGELKWGMDLVREHGTTIPPWYAGQCPLIEGDRVLLAPGGPEALLLAANLKTGEVLWKTPNPRAWKMTHSSIMAMEFEGQRMYVYCGHNGVAGVSASTGELLWDTTEWKISIATVPTPIILSGGRIFLSGGYDAGSLMLQLKKEDGRFKTETVYRLDAKTFGATQQTPILYNDRIYGVRPDNKFACLTPDGKILWTSPAGQHFGLGAFLLADNVIFGVNDSGLLRLFEASPEQYKLLGEAKVLDGREAWGPMALAGGRLLVRDLTRMVCLDVTRK